MTTIHLIRHGRASAGAEDYDQLHALGVEQARRLGAHLAASRQRFDAVYCGPLRRQRDTLQHMREAASEGGADWPQETVLEGLAEVALDEMAKIGLSDLVQHDAEARALVESLGAVSDDREATSRQMLRIFHHIALRWMRGSWQLDGFEDAMAFRARVMGAITRIGDEQTGREHVAVVTSNGVIGCVVDGLSGADVNHPGYRVPAFANSSVTRVCVTPAGLQLRETNLTPHLLDAALITLL